MKCPKCQTENESSARFCADCGSRMSTPRTVSPASRTRTPSQTTCPSCGRENPAGSAFCESCGAKLAAPLTSAAPAGQTAVRQTPGKTSGAWWLMPIFLGWLGGLVAWLIVRESDKSKAKRLLWLGIILTIVWIIISILFSVLAAFLEF